MEEDLKHDDCTNEVQADKTCIVNIVKPVNLEGSGDIEKEDVVIQDSSVGATGDAAPDLAIIPENNSETEISTGTNDQISLPNTSYTSILRGQPTDYDSSSNSSPTKSKRRVSFPPDDCDLIRYCEPHHEFPWMISKSYRFCVQSI